VNYDVFDLFLARTSRRRLHFVRPFARPALPVELKNAARKSNPPKPSDAWSSWAEGEEMSDPPRRRFMRPWKVIEHNESYEVQDAVGLPLASVYFENETIRQSSTRRLSKDEARRVAAQIARLPTLLRIEKGIDQGEA
jgi:hypothetical protein